MKKFIYIWLFVFALPLLLSAQSNNELLIEAYQLRKKGELVQSAEVIDQAVASKKGSKDTKAWHVRGFIYKDIYIKVDSSDYNSIAREKAVESFKKSIEFDSDKAYEEQNRKVLKYLGISYFNNASDIIREREPKNVEEANVYYEKYKGLMLYLNPDTVMTTNDIEFYLAMSTVHRKIYEMNRKEYVAHSRAQKEYLSKILQLDPQNFEANYSMAVSYYNEGANNLERLPEAGEISDIMEIQSQSIRSIEMALPFMMQAYEISPDKLEAVKGLKWIFFNLHRGDESLEMEKLEKELRSTEK
jgi:tetratricopeptide (TPR) repeat protein